MSLKDLRGYGTDIFKRLYLYNNEHIPRFVFFSLRYIIPFSFAFALFGFWYEFDKYERNYGRTYVLVGLVMIMVIISPFIIGYCLYGFRGITRSEEEK